MMARPLHLAWALSLSACFTGGFLAGQPCTADADCGPSLRCEAGVCGGGAAWPSNTATTLPDPPPTTDPPTTSVDPTTTTTSTSTTSSTTWDPVTSAATTDEPLDPTGAGCGIGRCKDLDILFVADNSPSMILKTLVMLDFILTFGSEMIPDLLGACSVHLGVTTTDAYAKNPPRCQQIGALVTADHNGKPCEFVEGLPYATLPDLETPLNLECMFNVGSNGSSDERPIDALFAAVGPTSPGLNAGCNGGFYRPNAFLIVIIVTDEDDDNKDAQGHDGSEEIYEPLWASTLKNLKPTGLENLYMVGVLGSPKPGEPACAWEPNEPPDGIGTEDTPKLRSFIQSLPANRHAIGTLCNVIPGGNAYKGLMDEIRAEVGEVCGA